MIHLHVVILFSYNVLPSRIKKKTKHQDRILQNTDITRFFLYHTFVQVCDDFSLCSSVPVQRKQQIMRLQVKYDDPGVQLSIIEQVSCK